MERENTLTVHFLTYGTDQQAKQTAEAILWDMKIKGYVVLHANHNGQTVLVPERKP